MEIEDVEKLKVRMPTLGHRFDWDFSLLRYRINYRGHLSPIKRDRLNYLYCVEYFHAGFVPVPRCGFSLFCFKRPYTRF